MVSVIMPTTGRVTMAQAARSVFEQTLPDWELILAVNNVDKVPISDLSEIDAVQRGDRIVWLNLGPLPLDYTTHRVRALPSARGTYVATLDDDDWYEPAFMKRMVAVLEEAGADLAYCASRLIDKATGDALGSYFHPFDGDLLPRCAYLLSNTIVMRRSVFDRVHWRPEVGYNSDWQFYVDAHAAGLKFVGVDEILSNARVVNGVWDHWAPGGYRRA
jgi:glycosyltransferase involved in cell wall biosynthesis